jgi:hypothetical protein
MAKEFIDILTRAAEVRDETGAGENNLNGGLFRDVQHLHRNSHHPYALRTQLLAFQAVSSQKPLR